MGKLYLIILSIFFISLKIIINPKREAKMNPNLANLDLLKLCTSSTVNKKMANLIKKQIQYGNITSEKVCKAMLQTDRGDFTDSSLAYIDSAQDIKYGATISAPHMHALALQYLSDFIKPGSRVLDVGSGSGYLTVAFSKLMDEDGIVVGVEHIPELYKKGIENVSRSHSNLINQNKIILKEGDGRKGCEEYAPYDAIHVGAASERVPRALVDQLKPGGRLMIPIGKIDQYIYLIDKDLQGKIKSEPVLTVRYVPLTDKEKQLAASETNIFGFSGL